MFCNYGTVLLTLAVLGSLCILVRVRECCQRRLLVPLVHDLILEHVL